MPYVEVALYSTFNPLTNCDLDAEFDFPQELLPILQRGVLDLGRFVLQLPAERINDATQDFQGQQIPKTKLVSVNEGKQQQQQQQVQQQEE